MSTYHKNRAMKYEAMLYGSTRREGTKMSTKHTPGPWYTVGEVEAAEAWRATTNRTVKRAKEAIEGMMYEAGSDTAAYMIARADYLAAKVLRDGEPTPLTDGRA